jgi:hypothetical protein
MNHDITASWDTLMRQASMTVHDYVTAIIGTIDEHFGKGYAKQNPALVAALVQATTADFRTTSLVVASQNVAKELNNIASAIRESAYQS